MKNYYSTIFVALIALNSAAEDKYPVLAEACRADLRKIEQNIKQVKEQQEAELKPFLEFSESQLNNANHSFRSILKILGADNGFQADLQKLQAVVKEMQDIPAGPQRDSAIGIYEREAYALVDRANRLIKGTGFGQASRVTAVVTANGLALKHDGKPYATGLKAQALVNMKPAIFRDSKPVNVPRFIKSVAYLPLLEGEPEQLFQEVPSLNEKDVDSGERGPAATFTGADIASLLTLRTAEDLTKLERQRAQCAVGLAFFTEKRNASIEEFLPESTNSKKDPKH